MSFTQSNKGTEGETLSISESKDRNLIISTVVLNILLYSHSTLDLETTFCLEEDQEIKLESWNMQKPIILRLLSGLA